MARDTRHTTRFGTWLRLGLRILGLLGLAVATAGVIAFVVELGHGPLSGLGNQEGRQLSLETFTGSMNGSKGSLLQVAAFGVAIGGSLAVLWLASELLSGLFLVTGRKSLASAGARLQVLLASALLVVFCAASFLHYARIDCTRDTRFTLDKPLIDELKQLDPTKPTTIVVVQMDRESVYDPELPDAISSSAQQKITEKVLDLVDDLRQHPELGARLETHVLSRKDEGFESNLTKLLAGREDLKGLRAAIETAPENSIFFAANGRIRRLPFSHFYQLDKTASRGKRTSKDAPNPAEANLVLVPQGKDRFVRALVGLEQRRPKVGLLVVHPYLTSREPEDDGTAAFSAFGLRSTLERNGFEVTDVVLKKGWEGGSSLTPAASTFEESSLEEIEAQYLSYSEAVLEAEIELQNLEAVRKRTQTGPLREVERMFKSALTRQLQESDREMLLKKLVDPRIGQLRADAEDAKKRAAEIEPKYKALLNDDRILADRRANDVRTKLAAATADCDLLIVPRYTTISLVNRAVIDPSLYPLVPEQTRAIREFLAGGKPVLFSLGAVPQRGPGATTDEVETLLQRMGVELSGQTVITSVEALAMKRPSNLGEKSAKLPPLEFALDGKDGPINPVASAFDALNRTVDGGLEVKRSGYRPISLIPQVGKPEYSPSVLRTTSEAWNEDRPLPEPASLQRRGYFPKFEPSKPDDPAKGTRSEERREAFTVGVAFEAKVPVEWNDPKPRVLQLSAELAGAGLDLGFPPGLASALMAPEQFDSKPVPKTARIAVFGHGGLFVGKKLEPGQEALLLTIVNWQLNRAEALPRDAKDVEPWHYPRAELDEKQRTYLWVGAIAGLPLLVAILGVIALMLRWLR